MPDTFNLIIRHKIGALSNIALQNFILYLCQITYMYYLFNAVRCLYPIWYTYQQYILLSLDFHYLQHREIHYHIAEYKNGVNRLNSEKKATSLKKIKSGNKK